MLDYVCLEVLDNKMTEKSGITIRKKLYLFIYYWYLHNFCSCPRDMYLVSSDSGPLLQPHC